MAVHSLTTAEQLWAASAEDPKTETVSAFLPGESERVFAKTESLSGRDVIPGFVPPIAEIFE